VERNIRGAISRIFAEYVEKGFTLALLLIDDFDRHTVQASLYVCENLSTLTVLIVPFVSLLSLRVSILPRQAARVPWLLFSDEARG